MSQFLTQIRRLEREIAKRQAAIEDWKRRMAEATDPASRSSLQSHITTGERQIEGWRAKIIHLQEAIERSRTVRR